MRLIDAEALKKEVENLVVGGAEGLKDYYENGSKSDENAWIGGIYDAWELIDNAPTVEFTEEQAIDKLHETGWLIRHDKEMTERPQGDLISREALKKVILNLPNENPSYYYTGDLLDRERVLDEIDNAPTVECVALTEEAYSDLCLRASRERPHGKWEILKGYYFTGGGDPVLICPFCHSEESKHMGGIEFPVNWNFCPTCGADMRGEE